MKINILGVQHEIIEKTIASEPHFLGKWIEAEQEIWINEKLPEHNKLLTEWHEVTHAILHAIGEPELGSNESFVERLSRALFQTAMLKKGLSDVVD